MASIVERRDCWVHCYVCSHISCVWVRLITESTEITPLCEMWSIISDFRKSSVWLFGMCFLCVIGLWKSVDGCSETKMDGGRRSSPKSRSRKTRRRKMAYDSHGRRVQFCLVFAFKCRSQGIRLEAFYIGSLVFFLLYLDLCYKTDASK